MCLSESDVLTPDLLFVFACIVHVCLSESDVLTQDVECFLTQICTNWL